MADGTYVDPRTASMMEGMQPETSAPAGQTLDPRTASMLEASPEAASRKSHATPPNLLTRGVNKLEHMGQDIWRGIGGDAAGYRAPPMDTSPQALAASREAQEYGGYSPQADAAASDAAAHAATAMGGGMLGAGAGAAIALGSGAAGQGDVRSAQRAQDIVGRALTYQPRNPNAAPAAQSFDTAMSLPMLASQRVVADPLKSVLPASAGPKVDYLSQFAPMLIDPALRGARVAAGALGRVGAAPVQPWETGAGATPPAPAPNGTGMNSRQAMGAAPVGRGAEGVEALRQPEKNGEFSPEDQADRVEALRRVGITGPVRQSAIAGNANDAGLQAGLTRFDALPEGRAAGEHFEQNERQPLIQHAESILDDLGSTMGTDPKTVQQRGNIIAQGVDSLRNWIKSQTDGLYAEARSVGGTTPTTTLGRVRDLVNGATPEAQDFQARLGSTADGEKLLSTMRNKLERDDANTGGAYNSNNAEDFRKFFNSAGVWSSDRSWAIRQLQHATDDDMFEAAGADVYQRGRQMHALSKTLLDDDPRLAKVFDVDPKGNRTTPPQDIPDTLLDLPQESINRFVELMQGAPADLQADTQAALNQARGHLVNRVLAVGAREGQVQRTFWNADGVNKALTADQLARESLFADAPRADEALTDLQNAGNVLKVDPVYRGAAAQTHSITDFLERHAEMTGGTIGGAVGGAVGGPVGAGIGSGAGASVARRIIAPFAERMRESRGNARWAEGMTDVGDAGEPSAGNGAATPEPSDRAGSIIPNLPPRATPRQAPPPPPPGSGGPGAPPGAPPGRTGSGSSLPPPSGSPPSSAGPSPSGASAAPAPRNRGASPGVQARTSRLAQQLGVPEEAIDGRVRGLTTQIEMAQRQRAQAHTDEERAYHDFIIDNLTTERGAVLTRNVTAQAHPKGGREPPPPLGVPRAAPVAPPAAAARSEAVPAAPSPMPPQTSAPAMPRGMPPQISGAFEAAQQIIQQGWRGGMDMDELARIDREVRARNAAQRPKEPLPSTKVPFKMPPPGPKIKKP